MYQYRDSQCTEYRCDGHHCMERSCVEHLALGKSYVSQITADPLLCSILSIDMVDFIRSVADSDTIAPFSRQAKNDKPWRPNCQEGVRTEDRVFRRNDRFVKTLVRHVCFSRLITLNMCLARSRR